MSAEANNGVADFLVRATPPPPPLPLPPPVFLFLFLFLLPPQHPPHSTDAQENVMKRRAKKEDMRTTRNPQTNDCGQLPTGACLHSGRKPEVQLMTHPDTAGDRKYPSMLKQIWKVERWSGGEVERWGG